MYSLLARSNASTVLSLIAFLTISTSGCFLAAPTRPVYHSDPPEEGTSYHCVAQLQSADGHVETLSSLRHTDLVRNVDGEALPRLPLATCSGARCPQCGDYDNEASVTAEWRDIIDWAATPDRIPSDVIALNGTFLDRHEGPWCVWPESVTCTPQGPVDFPMLRGCLEDPPSVMPFCEGPPPPPSDQCLEITCNGLPCGDSFDFGTFDEGRTAGSLVVEITNCGDLRSEPIDIVALENPLLPGSDPGFHAHSASCANEGLLELVPQGSTRIGSRTSRCQIAGFFLASRQELSGQAEGALSFFTTYEVPPQNRFGLREHRIDLLARVEPDFALSFEEVVGPDEFPLPDDLCFSGTLDGCTGTRTIRATNTGEEPVTVRSAAVDEAARANWQVNAVPPLPRRLNPGESVDVTMGFCRVAGTSVQSAVLTIQTDPPSQGREWTLMRRSAAQGGCPPGS